MALHTSGIAVCGSQWSTNAADVVDSHDISCLPAADLAFEYNRRLASSNSARTGGRHYAAGCLYSRLPDDCLVIDNEVGGMPNVDIIIDVSPIGGCTH